MFKDMAEGRESSVTAVRETHIKQGCRAHCIAALIYFVGSSIIYKILSLVNCLPAKN